VKIKHKGFTLIELLITIAIVGIIAAIATPSFITQINRNQLSTAADEIRLVALEVRSEAVLRRSNRTLSLVSTISGADKSWQPSEKLTWDTVPTLLEYNPFGYMLGADRCYVLSHAKDTSLKAVIRLNTNGSVIYNKNQTAC
jgi:prepilin-type N-terminal cleavage/methylation domain-containing protein